MEIKYNTDKKLVLCVLNKEYDFESDNDEIIKLLTDPKLTFDYQVTISNEIIIQQDLTFAKNYEKFLNDFLKSRVVFNSNIE